MPPNGAHLHQSYSPSTRVAPPGFSHKHREAPLQHDATLLKKSRSRQREARQMALLARTWIIAIAQQVPHASAWIFAGSWFHRSWKNDILRNLPLTRMQKQTIPELLKPINVVPQMVASNKSFEKKNSCHAKSIKLIHGSPQKKNFAGLIPMCF